MLTSLLDMFTIILIFLIVSFEAESYEFRLDPDLKLPESSARALLKPAVNMSVTRGRVLVENKLVVVIPTGADLDKAQAAGEIAQLVEPLSKIYEARFGEDPVPGEPVHATDEAEEADGPIIVVQADRKLDYSTLYLVLRSAARSGFYRYRLAIMKI